MDDEPMTQDMKISLADLMARPGEPWWDLHPIRYGREISATGVGRSMSEIDAKILDTLRNRTIERALNHDNRWGNGGEI